MAIRLVLSSKEILNKVFKGVPRGYDPYEVDQYLDKIISDYQKVEENVLLAKDENQKLLNRIKELEKQNQNLEIELGKYKTKYDKIKPTDNVTDDNINLIKRIRTLETFLWQNGYNPNSIK